MTSTSTAAVHRGLRPPSGPATAHRFAPTAVPLGLAALAEAIADRSATVAVVGLGYVGVPLLVAAGAERFRLIGVDSDAAKVKGLREGKSHVVDVAPEDLVWSGDEITWDGRAQFSTDPCLLVAADVIVVAVPTPLRDGTPDLSLVRGAMEDVARALRPGQLIVLESTTYPGTTEEVVLPILEATGLVVGRDFALAYSPERISPGDGRSLREVPKIVAGLTQIDTERIRHAAGSGGGQPPTDPSAAPIGADGDELTAPATSPGRRVRVGPASPGTTSTTAGGPALTQEPTTTTTEPSTTTTSTEPPSTTATEPVEQHGDLDDVIDHHHDDDRAAPPTTTTTGPPTTTTTRPPDTTTTTTRKPCRGKGHDPCRR